ncbi:MAG TPA: SRPBCC domain-containing protein [Edaphobacter sp.]|nr:SRPBCC domain-containing protein [Edaphobacter sp.]
MPRGNESIEVDYILEHPPEQVWRLLTERELLEKWLMPNDIAPEVGHKFNFRTKPVGNWDGVVFCEVLESSPVTRFVYSWKGGSVDNANYGHELDTVVTWTLTPTSEGGTLLHLSHDGFNPDDYAFKIMSGGWRQMNAGNIFSRLLNGELVAARECDR